MTDLTRDEYEELILTDCAFLIGALDEGDQKKRIIDALRKSPEYLYELDISDVQIAAKHETMVRLREELEVAETQVDSMLDHIAPEERLDDLNGKLSQISNWLAGSAPEHHKMRRELEQIINQHSVENGSDTPDFILAEFLTGSLATYDRALQARELFFGRKLSREEVGDVPSPFDAEPPSPDVYPSATFRRLGSDEWGVASDKQLTPAELVDVTKVDGEVASVAVGELVEHIKADKFSGGAPVWLYRLWDAAPDPPEKLVGPPNELVIEDDLGRG